MKRVTRTRTRKKPRRIWRWFLGAFLVGSVLFLLGLGTVAKLTEAGLPPVPSFPGYAESVPKVSRVVARDGTVIAEFFTERRTVIWPDSIPPTLERAVLAAEDAGFYEHEGLSYWGIARAMAVNLWRGRVSQGGSTITQQVVKQVLLTAERSVERKFRELLLARLLERRMSKKEILAVYLSEVYLGHGCYGFEEAARFYFGRRAADLDLAEAAVLAGLVSAPEAHSPMRNPAAAVGRQHYVLQRMVDLGFVTAGEGRKAAAERMMLVGRDETRRAAYFVETVRREVARLFGEGRLLHDGMIVETTLDPRASDAADTAVALGLADLHARGRTRVADEASALAAGEISDGMDDLEESLPPPPRAVRARVVSCDRASGLILVEAGGHRAVLDPLSLGRLVLAGRPDPWAICGERDEVPVSLAGETREVGGESLPVVNADLGPEAAVVVLDPHDRGVLAIAGGFSFAVRPFNRANQSRRPIGSTVKPFLYAAAVEAGLPPDSTFANTAVHFRGGHGRGWSPRNYEGGFDGKDYTLSEALARSINVIAVKVLARIKTDKVVDLLERLGFSPPIPGDLTLALGSVEASPLTLANAMATFAASGMYDTPHLVKRVIDYRGEVLMEHRGRPSREFSTSTAERLRSWMRGAVTEGTAIAAASLPVPAWGKTGTTNRSREAWFVGSDGRRVVSVLVGYDDRLPMHKATGGNTAVGFFNEFIMLSGR